MAAVVLLAGLSIAVPTASAHCGLPTTVECVIDWVDAVGDGRWCEIAKSILGIDLVKCPVIWVTTA